MNPDPTAEKNWEMAEEIMKQNCDWLDEKNHKYMVEAIKAALDEKDKESNKLKSCRAFSIGEDKTVHMIECENCADLSDRLKKAEDFITRMGYRSCDIPACNCGSWHGGLAELRLREIKDEVWENGKTILQSVIDLRTRNERLDVAARKVVDWWKQINPPIADDFRSLTKDIHNLRDALSDRKGTV